MDLILTVVSLPFFFEGKLASSEKRLASSLDRQLVQDLGAPDEGVSIVCLLK